MALERWRTFSLATTARLDQIHLEGNRVTSQRQDDQMGLPSRYGGTDPMAIPIPTLITTTGTTIQTLAARMGTIGADHLMAGRQPMEIEDQRGR